MTYYDEATLYFDGACKSNPDGEAGCGWVLLDIWNEKIAEGRKYLGSSGYTNNVAEYFGLLEGLKFLRDSDIEVEHLVIRGDSELIINQIDGSYRVKSRRLRPLKSRAMRLLGAFNNYEVECVDRDNNSDADKMANHAINYGNDVTEFY
mmetsp:Transcript_8479/g.15521  ORF Transcript_8479/g.15521 Transcript_8479/m.15521 type:complete len:149 (-) Transcript_8479:239-685(-)